jgi:nucleoid-associated protein YgaU
VRRLAWIALVTPVLLLTACQNQNKKPDTHPEEPAKPLDQMTTGTPTDDPYADTNPPAGPIDRPGVAPKTKAKHAEEPLTPGGGKTYVVQKGDTLHSIARKCYNGDASQWKKIWEANKTRIPNKDKLTVGTKLIIP